MSSMPSWAWWLLAASVILAVIIMIISFIVTRRKIVKIRNSYLTEMTEVEKENSAKAFERENHGTILHDLKPKKGFVQDVEMEYSFNTFVRNGYKTFKIFNATSEYEKQSFEQIINAKESDKYDFALLIPNGDSFNQLKEVFENLNPKGIILVPNAVKRNKEIKTIRSDLKLLGYRHEWQDVSNGIILIAK